MSSGGGGGSTTTVQKADPWAGQQPFLQSGFNYAAQQFNAGGPQYYGQSTVAPLSNQTQQAVDLSTQRALNGSPLQNAANQQITATMNGDYLTANPYLEGALQSGFDDASKAYNNTIGGINSGFQGAGRYGSGAQQFATQQAQDVLSKNMTNAASTAYANNYANERDNQIKASYFTPQLLQEDYRNIDQLSNTGAFLDTRNQDVLNADINKFNYNQNLPYQNLQNYMNLIQGNYGGTTNSTQTGQQAGGNKLGSALGGAAIGAQFGGPIGAGVGGIAGLLGLF